MSMTPYCVESNSSNGIYMQYIRIYFFSQKSVKHVRKLADVTVE